MTRVMDLIKGLRNVRNEMNVPPSRKAELYIVSEVEAVRDTFASLVPTYKTLAMASLVKTQADKTGIADDAVSVVIPDATVFMPLSDLVDMEKEKERLEKEEKRLQVCRQETSHPIPDADDQDQSCRHDCEKGCHKAFPLPCDRFPIDEAQFINLFLNRLGIEI